MTTATNDTFKGSKTRHGTASGYSKHQALNEKPCDACTLAKKKYDAERLAVPKHALLNRAYAAAQARALRRLKNAHPDEYRRYYQEESAKVK